VAYVFSGLVDDLSLAPGAIIPINPGGSIRYLNTITTVSSAVSVITAATANFFETFDVVPWVEDKFLTGVDWLNSRVDEIIERAWR
jgi:hypothetical protein